MSKKTNDPYTSGPLSLQQLITVTDIERQARALATQRLPTCEQTSLSKAEALVVELADARFSARQMALEDEAQAIDEQLTELPDPRLDRNLKTLAVHVLNEIMAAFWTHASTIKTTVAAERDSKAELNAFRDANDLLHRLPDYPLSRIQHFALIVLMAMLEAAANMTLFFNGTPAGLAGALTCALLIAACNIGIAVFAGLLPLRHLNLPGWRVRLWAIPTLVVAGALILLTNVYAAHFRQVAGRTGAHGEAAVLAHLAAHPFELSLPSFALLLFGLLFAVYAVFKAYTASDPFPGYERQHRRHVDCQDDLAYLKAAIHGGLDAVRQAEIVYAADRPQAVQALIEAIHKRFAALSAAGVRARALHARDVAAATAAINRFRTLNLSIRTDGVTPAYFATPITFPAFHDQGDAVARLGARIEVAAAHHLEHTEKFLDLITTLLQQVETAKDNTDRIMAAIEKSCVDDSAVPDLADLRQLIVSQQLIPVSPGEAPCTAPAANSATTPTAVAS